jgi:WD40 repeat protein
VYALDWSPEENTIVAAGNGEITVYDATTMEIILHQPNAHEGRVNDVAFAPGGTLIVSGGDDGALKLWSVISPPP